ncbi:hypothetical protein BCU85_15960 [Vibrio lentus]|uniref:Outer membrane protein beta-barrel domain-containing protein n=1 Tax=Vibrio lentus TaxID=136468 RepID=A0AA45A849_9VIBR|nr:hypothetical protein [Vibrio lentus]OBS97521.1 hypothetical protein A9261_13005 [Vibrio tasmaniensis]MCB5358471.1 hypothetical protein [Vibrio lentus]MCB5448939.1 hypothetical protein [Vibrio lentus]MCB5460826.1 hypothetical protein [Vibrio lentus]MCC4795201.1 hypothetical protein [Vibrio lentus]
MTNNKLPLLILAATLFFTVSEVQAYEQNQEETAITFGLSAERGWRDWSASYIKYRGPGSIGYGIEFTRSAYNTENERYEYKQRDNEYQFHAPIGITKKLYITPGYGVKRTHINERTLDNPETSDSSTKQVGGLDATYIMDSGFVLTAGFDKAEGENLEFSIGAGIAW